MQGAVDIFIGKGAALIVDYQIYSVKTQPIILTGDALGFLTNAQLDAEIGFQSLNHAFILKSQEKGIL